MYTSFPESGSELYSFDTAEKGSLQAFLNITLYINRPLHVSTFKTAAAVPGGGSIVRGKINGSISSREGACIFKSRNPVSRAMGSNMVDKKREDN